MASTANVLKADLTTALPARRAEHRRNEVSLECCPPGAVLTAAEAQRSRIDLDHTQVSIVDTEPTVAHALVHMLQAEGLSARTFASERELIAQPAPALGGCLIADVTRPGLAGLELQRALTARHWQLPVIFLTSAGDTKAVVRGMRAGALNCLPKPVQPEELLEAVREALAESRAVHAQRAAQLRVRQMLERLTPREREVLDLALDGLLVKQIAARLGTAEKTIKTHKGRLMRKMEVRSTLALVQLMVTTGISLRGSGGEPARPA